MLFPVWDNDIEGLFREYASIWADNDDIVFFKRAWSVQASVFDDNVINDSYGMHPNADQFAYSFNACALIIQYNNFNSIAHGEGWDIYFTDICSSLDIASLMTVDPFGGGPAWDVLDRGNVKKMRAFLDDKKVNSAHADEAKAEGFETEEDFYEALRPVIEEHAALLAGSLTDHFGSWESLFFELYNHGRSFGNLLDYKTALYGSTGCSTKDSRKIEAQEYVKAGMPL